MRLKIHDCKIVPKRRFDIALITGDGRTLHDDLRTFLEWGLLHDVMAIGRSINAYPGRVGHWVNVDGADSKWWAEHLQLKNDGKMPIRHTMGDCEGYDVDWDDERTGNDPWHGSTALFAVFVALEMGFQKIVLAGCPLDSKGHWFSPPEEEGPVWTKESFEAWREFSRTPDADKVRSLSGFTAEVLGLAKKENCNS